MITENTSTLKINKLTKEQYIREKEAGNIDTNAFYLTPDETADLTIYATKEDIEGLEESKQDASTAITTDNIASQSVNHAKTADGLTGVTATASELNVLDGITASTAELNYMDGVTSPVQTQIDGLNSNLASKANTSHSHDDRYYTETEVNNLLNAKQNSNTAITTSNIANQSVKYATSAGSANAVAWGNVTGKPSTYKPASHTHDYLPLSGGTVSGATTINNDIKASNFKALDNRDAYVVAGYSSKYVRLCASQIHCNNTGVSANVPIYASAFTNPSSRRYKENIQPLTEEDAKKILQLNPVTYDYINKAEGTNCMGMIAEEVAEVETYPVIYNDDGIVDGLDYSKFVPQLIKMVQIQQSKIDKLEEILSKLGNN